MKIAMNEERDSNKVCQKEIEYLKSIIESYKRTKQKWKDVMLEMSKRLEDKIQELCAENYRLKMQQQQQCI